jgi:hypothetical protein
MGKQVLEENVLKHFCAIDLCLENALLMPALVLIYNGIDTFASLSRESTQEKATRKEFIEWCEKYLLPINNLKCNGLDLYAARCGILHTYTAVSDLSKRGNAVEILYCLGDIAKEKYQKLLEKYPRETIIINIEDLDKAFKSGYFSFIDDVKNYPEKESLLYERAKYFFLNRPANLA